jgi:hypothetical protein
MTAASLGWMFSLRGVVRFFVFDPQDRNVAEAQADDLWRSRDRGDTWSLVYPKASSVKEIKMSSDHADEDLIAEPNPLGSITGMAIDPADSRIIYVVAGDKKKGCLLSLSRGTKERVGRSRKEWMNTTYWLEFNPQTKGRVWSVHSWTHDLPKPKMWRTQSIQHYRGGVCRSEDGERTWAKSNEGMEQTAATHILLDPASPPEARVLYVAASGRGMYKA